MTFEDPDPDRFPALRLAKNVLVHGGVAPAAMNAADEIAVSAFLERRIGFLDISAVVEETLARMDQLGLLRAQQDDPVEGARAADAQARGVAIQVVDGLKASAHA